MNLLTLVYHFLIALIPLFIFLIRPLRDFLRTETMKEGLFWFSLTLGLTSWLAYNVKIYNNLALSVYGLGYALVYSLVPDPATALIIVFGASEYWEIAYWTVEMSKGVGGILGFLAFSLPKLFPVTASLFTINPRKYIYLSLPFLATGIALSYFAMSNGFMGICCRAYWILALALPFALETLEVKRSVRCDSNSS